MKSVVITGGDGFLGRHVCNYLVSSGYEVYAIVLPESTFLANGLERLHIVKGNISECEGVLRDLPSEPEAFLHLAWGGVTPDLRHDYAFQLQNVDLALEAVKLARRIQTKKFIFPGSTMEYAYNEGIINEKSLPAPMNAYGVAKISARYACESLCRDLEIPYVYCVISGIYSEDRKDNNVIYYTIDKLLNNEMPMLTALEQKWDYVHIDDVVYALELVIANENKNRFYAIGHGDNCRLSEYIFQIKDIICPKAELGIGMIPYDNGRMPDSRVDLTPLVEDTGYVPRVEFKDGIARVINRIKNERELSIGK